MFTYKVIKINTITNEVTTILENETVKMFAKNEAIRANNGKGKNEVVKLLNYKDEELPYGNIKKVEEKNYKTQTRVCGTYIKMY